MLCNNVDVRRCSYFELGLPVLKLDFGRMKRFACHRYQPPSVSVLFSVGNCGGRKYRRTFLVILPVRQRRICNGFLDLLLDIFSIGMAWDKWCDQTKKEIRYKTVNSNQNFCRKLSITQSVNYTFFLHNTYKKKKGNGLLFSTMKISLIFWDHRDRKTSTFNS